MAQYNLFILPPTNIGSPNPDLLPNDKEHKMREKSFNRSNCSTMFGRTDIPKEKWWVRINYFTMRLAIVMLVVTFSLITLEQSYSQDFDANLVLQLEIPPILPPKAGALPDTKLAPEIEATQKFGGQLIGQTKTGTALYLFKDKQELKRARKDVANYLIKKQNQKKRGTPTFKKSNVYRVSNEKIPTRDNIHFFSRFFITYAKGTAQKNSEPAGLKVSDLKKIGLKLEGHDRRGRFLMVSSTNGISSEAANVLAKEKNVEFVEPNYRYSLPKPPNKEQLKKEKPKILSPSLITPRTETIPNDPSWNQLWGMRNIHAPDAWDSVTRSGRIIAVIDTGIDLTNHPDIQNNLWTNSGEIPGDGIDNDNNGFVDDIHGFDFFNNDGDPQDSRRHGTHCAGTIAAVGNDAFGVVGVNWRAQIMAVQIFGATGVASVRDIARAIRYAADNGADVLSNSWGGGSFSLVILNAIEDARTQGAVFVAAAGNNNGQNNDVIPHYPSSYNSENIVSVMSITSRDNPSGFSNIGNVSVDIAAPGSWIWSTVPGGGHQWMSGTSMATPHVSGAIGLTWGHPKYTGLSYKGIVGLLFANSRPLASLNALCATEGTLDIAFLAPPIPPSGEAYISFPENAIRQASNLGSIVFRLEEEMFVHITAQSSGKLTYPTRGKGVSCGFSRTSAPGKMEPSSIRNISFSKRGSLGLLSASLGVKLKPGIHRYFFQVLPKDRRGIILETTPGTIMVEAFGRKLGGNLFKIEKNFKKIKTTSVQPIK